MEAKIGNTPRKKLGDISNLPLQMRLSNHDKKPQYIASKEYVETLQKENLALIKMLADKNKIIEITGVEIEKLRINLHKMQQQNRQLAQANTQMLAELNSDKDRLKALQHELGCKNGLLRAKMFEAEVKPTKSEEAGDLSLGNEDDGKAGNLKRRGRSKSLAPSKQVQSEDETENKRTCVRRQSLRLKPEAPKHNEDSFEAEDERALAPPRNDSVQENGSTDICRSSSSLECNPSLRSEPIQSGRSSLSRPSRDAAKKVQSYKEIPLNIKMRRPQ